MILLLVQHSTQITLAVVAFLVSLGIKVTIPLAAIITIIIRSSPPGEWISS